MAEADNDPSRPRKRPPAAVEEKLAAMYRPTTAEELFGLGPPPRERRERVEREVLRLLKSESTPVTDNGDSN